MRSNHMTSVVEATKTTRPRSKHEGEDHVAFVLAMRTATGPTYNELLSYMIASIFVFQFFCKVNSRRVLLIRLLESWLDVEDFPSFTPTVRCIDFKL